MSKIIEGTVAMLLGQAPACPACGQASAAVVNGQRLTAKQLAKFNKERLDKTSKR